jgi:hypothetical protein
MESIELSGRSAVEVASADTFGRFGKGAPVYRMETSSGSFEVIHQATAVDSSEDDEDTGRSVLASSRRRR